MGRSESEAILTSFLEHKCPKPAEAAQKPQSTKITFDSLCSLHHSKDLFGAKREKKEMVSYTTRYMKPFYSYCEKYKILRLIKQHIRSLS